MIVAKGSFVLGGLSCAALLASGLAVWLALRDHGEAPVALAPPGEPRRVPVDDPTLTEPTEATPHPSPEPTSARPEPPVAERPPATGSAPPPARTDDPDPTDATGEAESGRAPVADRAGALPGESIALDRLVGADAEAWRPASPPSGVRIGPGGQPAAYALEPIPAAAIAEELQALLAEAGPIEVRGDDLARARAAVASHIRTADGARELPAAEARELVERSRRACAEALRLLAGRTPGSGGTVPGATGIPDGPDAR